MELDVRGRVANRNAHFALGVLFKRAVAEVQRNRTVLEGKLRAQVVVTPGAEVGSADVFLVAIRLLPLHREPVGHVLVDGTRDEAVQAMAIEGRKFRRGAGPELPFGSLVDVVDGAADGVAPVERTLGSPKHLHAIDVVQRTDDAVGFVEVEIVRVLRHGDVAGESAVEGSHAADRCRAVQSELQARNADLEVLVVGDLVVLDHVAVEGGHRDGRVQQRLFLPVGGHDDLFQHKAVLILVFGILFAQGVGTAEKVARASHDHCQPGRSSHGGSSTDYQTTRSFTHEHQTSQGVFLNRFAILPDAELDG